MPRNVLNAQKVKAAQPGQKLGDGGGLRLIVGKDGRRWWEYRYRFGGKDFTLGCGGGDTTLAQARALRNEYEAQLKAGTNPKATKEAQRAESQFTGTMRDRSRVTSSTTCSMALSGRSGFRRCSAARRRATSTTCFSLSRPSLDFPFAHSW